MITFDTIAKYYGGNPLFENVSIAIHDKERTGLIGVNGSGKTTLLRMLAGEESPDHGTIGKPTGFTIGYLPQEVELFDALTPIAIVLAPFAHLLDYERKFDELARIAENEEAMRKLAALHHAVEFHDVYSLEARAEAILAGLGVPKDKWRGPLTALSGGYRMRVVLGKLLLLSPDFLLLDEPTNHLDMDSLVWLEKFLSRYKGGMLIVSHDRDFLNRMTGFTAEIRNRTMMIYKGNYDAYIAIRDQTLETQVNRARRLQEQIAQKERFVERFKAKNTKATQAASRLKQIEKLKELMPPIEKGPDTIEFTFPETIQSGGVPFKLRDVTMRYGSVEVFRGLTMEIRRADRVAIVGPNGSGKSTLLKLMAGLLPAADGVFEAGYNTVIRYFGQHQLEQLDLDKTLYQTVAATAVKTEKVFIRNVLGAFLFSGDDVDKEVRVLSGGEKSRLVLATMMANPGNTLLLDEPTNHLDINSIETLLHALEKFPGTIVMVSHDDYFVSRIADRIIEMRPGLIRDFPGNLSDYRSYIEAGLWGSGENGAVADSAMRDEQAEKEARIRKREERKKLQRVVEKLEKEIETMEGEIARLKADLNDAANASDHAKLHELSRSIESKELELMMLMDKWEKKHGDLKARDGE
ncbi:MAG: ABC-F family ATP-binding cassette domain-containing protein [Chitinispirillaceae bacterium]|jgi:ATP-binding cassette subfamily F protein 3